MAGSITFFLFLCCLPFLIHAVNTIDKLQFLSFITEGSSSQDESDFTSEYDSGSMITHGRSSEDKFDFFISEYDSDSLEQVAN